MAHQAAAKRYAKALFDLAGEKQVRDQVHADLGALVALLETSEDWRGFIQNPYGSLDRRESVIRNSLDGSVHPLTVQFLAYINRKHRIELFPEIHRAWQAMYDESKNIIRARVISAGPLDREQQNLLAEKLRIRFGKDVVLTIEVDGSLIGGLKVFVGDHVFDHSIESRLQQLEKSMLKT